jgi:hypothetical protein
MEVSMQLRKGTRVEFDVRNDDGSVTVGYGVVRKGGSKTIEVVEDGGIYSRKAHASRFRPSSKPITRDDPDSPMLGYAVVRYQEFKEMSEETVAYRCEFARGSVVIGDSKNQGHGGPDCHFAAIGQQEAFNEFKRRALSWYEKYSGEKIGKYTNPIDDWLHWYVDARPYGMSERDYFKQQKEMFDAIK